MNLRLDLNRNQRLALLIAAALIILVQLIQFGVSGIEGSGWVWAFLVAGVLIIVAISNVHRPVGDSRTPAPLPPLSPVELEKLHAAYRDTGEVLAVEVEQRAGFLANALREQADQATIAIADAMPGMAQFSEMLTLQIHQSCLWLMLGLVGMRRSNGRETYVGGIEFMALQTHVAKIAMQMAVKAHASTPIREPIQPDFLAKAMLEEVKKVRHAIVRYCFAKQARHAEPEGEFLDWFKSQTGMVVKGREDIAKALAVPLDARINIT